MAITNRRKQNPINVKMRIIEIASSISIKYLGLQLDLKLRFKEHVTVVTMKANKITQNIARIMPNLGVSKSMKRRLLATVVTSQLLYEAQSWADMM